MSTAQPVAAAAGKVRAGAAPRHGLPLPAWPLVLLALLLFVLPVYLMFKISLSSTAEILRQQPAFWFEQLTFEHWAQVLSSGNLWPPLWKSLSVATFATLVALLLATPAAYVISRFPRNLRYAAIMSLFFTRMFPDVGVALPIAVIFLKWGLLDTSVGLALAHATLTLPLAGWVLVGTFATIPRDLEEAAAVDGASRVRTLLTVILPLALPGLAVASIFAWLMSWNEFTFSMFLTLTRRTLPLTTYYYVVRGNWFLAAAYSGLLTIPVLAVTLFLQRWLHTGYLSGSVKG